MAEMNPFSPTNVHGASQVTADADREFCYPEKSAQSKWDTRTSAGRENAEKNEFYGPHSQPGSYKAYTKFRIISRYNFKGGVGKTTGTYSLGWELAHRDSPDGHRHKVLMVDADPQRSLTKLALGRDVRILTENENYEHFFSREPLPEVQQSRNGNELNGRWNLFEAMAPAIVLGKTAQRDLLPAQPFVIGGTKANLCLLPAHKMLPVLDERLTHQLRNDAEEVTSVAKLGSFFIVMQMTAAFYKFDYILIDLPPNMGAITRVALMSSHFFQIPFFPDFFSWEAIRDLHDMLQGAPNDGDDHDDDDDDEEPLTTDDQVRKMIRYTLRNDKSWFQWAQSKSKKDIPSEMKMPNMKRLRFPGLFQQEDYEGGPKFLGAHLTRFASTYIQDQQGAPARCMVRNCMYWYYRIKAELAIIQDHLPVSMRLSFEPVQEPWRTDEPYVNGWTEEYNQLAAISQRDSLPVAILEDKMLKKPGGDGQSLTKIPGEERRRMVDAILRHKEDIERTATNMLNLMQQG